MRLTIETTKKMIILILEDGEEISDWSWIEWYGNKRRGSKMTVGDRTPTK